jgi:hypothetical protein
LIGTTAPFSAIEGAINFTFSDSTGVFPFVISFKASSKGLFLGSAFAESFPLSTAGDTATTAQAIALIFRKFLLFILLYLLYFHP